MSGSMIVFSGKGGSGKTTVATLVLREILRSGGGPVLAVDADPNSTFGVALGLGVESTIAELREDMGEAARNPGEIPKDRLMEQWLAELLIEDRGFDLLTMGRPEGPKCYCYVNSLLRRYLQMLRGNYPYVIVDCEAGMEYLSRLTLDDVDTLVLVAEDTYVGLETARRIAGMADALPIDVHRRILAVNKVGAVERDAGPAGGALRSVPGVDDVIEIPYDRDLLERWSRGQSLDDAAGPKARSAIGQLARQCLEPNNTKTHSI